MAFAKEAVETTDRELETSAGRTGLGWLGRSLLAARFAFAASHCCVLFVEKGVEWEKGVGEGGENRGWRWGG